MKKNLILFIIIISTSTALFAHEWDIYPVPANAGTGKVWELQENQSDDFNYIYQPVSGPATIGDKWTNYYHNSWTGPTPTIWRYNHVYTADGQLKIKTSRPTGSTSTYTGCITSKQRVIYPVYVESYVKLANSVMASDVWMLSPDETQEIDICEAYGGDRVGNEWFAQRLHLSHHVFIRSPFTDWQPTDGGSWYVNGTTWRNDFHRIGVYWIDPWNLEYYVDGVKVRTRSGVNEIDPLNYLGGTGLNKELDIIINMEDQTWRANQGLTPTLAELANEDNNTFKVEWIRIYKPIINNTAVKMVNDITIQLYPNPSKDFVQVKSDKIIKQVVFCQLNGAVVKSEMVNNSTKNISVKEMNSGLYLLKIESEDGNWTIKKLVKE